MWSKEISSTKIKRQTNKSNRKGTEQIINRSTYCKKKKLRWKRGNSVIFKKVNNNNKNEIKNQFVCCSALVLNFSSKKKRTKRIKKFQSKENGRTNEQFGSLILIFLGSNIKKKLKNKREMN